MRFPPICLLALMAVPTGVFAQQSSLYDPSIQHMPKDGIVKMYGAGGPHTAFQKVADAWAKKTGQPIEIIAGPESRWSAAAQADADILWGTSEQSMTAFLETYLTFSSETVTPIYVRPSIIAVKAGNPKGISSFEDLLADDVRIVVTEGAGVYNTSGTGVWEDVAGRLGKLGDIAKFRKNIVAFAKGSGASFRAFKDMDADAWITWPNWPATNGDVLEMVALSPERQVWRDVNVALSPESDPAAQDFLDFLLSEEAQTLMRTEGWLR